jgi:nucleoside-diphosphate-sugar epimerase
VTNPIVVTGSASGLGAAVVRRLRDAGRPTIGVDVQVGEFVDLIADLGTPDGRAAALAAVAERAEALDGLVSCAAVSPIHPDPAVVVSVNGFGALAARRSLCSWLRSTDPAAVAISSIGAVDGSADESLVAVLRAYDEDAAAAAETAPPTVGHRLPSAKRVVAQGAGALAWGDA